MNKFQVKESKNVLFWLCLILGIIMISMTAVEFFLPAIEIPLQLTIAYPVLLVVFVAIKEVVRWGNGQQSSRAGELFVILWWGVFLAMAVAGFVLRLLGFDGERFVIPSGMLNICLEVLVIYASSEISKKIHQFKNGKNGQNNKN